MKSSYRVSLYYNPIFNNEGASMVVRTPLHYNGGYKLTRNLDEHGVCSCNFDAAEFVFDCRDSRIPLIEYKKSCIPPLTKLGNKAEVMKRWRLRYKPCTK